MPFSCPAGNNACTKLPPPIVFNCWASKLGYAFFIDWLYSPLFETPAVSEFPIAKYFEIQWNLANGINGESGIFFTVYYYLTLNHLVHATWGILGILWVLARHLAGGYSADDHVGLEALASYWHATDIIWLVIFPFFYVLA